MLEIPPEVEKKTSTIEGHLSNKEGALLYSLARQADNTGSIVELGSFKGRSTVWMGLGSLSGEKAQIVAIDPGIGSNDVGNYPTKDAFLKNIKGAGVSEIIKPIFKTSEDASKEWDSPISLLFIDAAHDYQNVTKDFVLWEPRLINDSFVAMHDCLNPAEGPVRVFLEKVLLSGRFSDFGMTDSIMFARKRPGNYSPKVFILARLLKFHIFLTQNRKRLPRKFVYLLMKVLLRNLIGLTANYKI